MSDSPPTDSCTTEISYDEALATAMKLHRVGKLEPAEQLYRVLRQAMPNDPNPLHYLGVLLHQRGRTDEGLSSIRQSIQIDPNVASWHNNLGNVLLDTGRSDDAASAYVRCTELDPENADVLNNLGVLLRNLKRYEESEATFKRALEKNPTSATAHTNIASLYYELKRIPEGHEHIAAVLASEPGDPTARKVLGLLYASMGRLEEAAAIFRVWLEHEPNSEQAKHHLAACTREGSPDRASQGYVEQVFDSFAGSFDAKLATLEYRAPRLIGEAVARTLGAPQGNLKIIDAGCGTGLCGSFLAPYAARLVGVDLSANMLERARARGEYAELVKADLVAYLENGDETADLIVSADTLCYFGRIDEAVQGARRSLRSAGHFFFTVESHSEPSDFKLNPSGRYSHARAYVERVMADARFEAIRVEPVQLRNEAAKPVEGWIVAGRASS